MNERQRYFTEAEIQDAKDRLTILAHVSALFWAEALMSDHFMYKGKVSYISGGYKSGSWRDYPAREAEIISTEQILNFIKAYEAEAGKRIEREVESDEEVAYALGMDRSQINPRYAEDGTEVKIEFHGCPGISYGGWDNDPMNEVAKAMKKAEISGAMKNSSGYRKSRVVFRDGEIFKQRYGTREETLKVL